MRSFSFTAPKTARKTAPRRSMTKVSSPSSRVETTRSSYNVEISSKPKISYGYNDKQQLYHFRNGEENLAQRCIDWKITGEGKRIFSSAAFKREGGDSHFSHAPIGESAVFCRSFCLCDAVSRKRGDTARDCGRVAESFSTALIKDLIALCM